MAGSRPFSIPHMKCRGCGSRVPPESAFCPLCGTVARASACAQHPRAVARHCCVVCGTAVCKDCRAGTRHASLCSDHAGVPILSGWSEVLRVAGELEAGLAAGILRGAGIEAQVLSQKDRANVVTFGALSVVRVLVPAGRFEEAVLRLTAEQILPG